MSIEEIIRVVSLSISLFISLTGFVITLVKSIVNAIKTKNWNALRAELQTFISKAEGFEHFTGTEKKEIVLAWASNYCASKGMKFDANKVGTEIEELVALTKKVNQRDKDKVVEVETASTEPKITIV